MTVLLCAQHSDTQHLLMENPNNLTMHEKNDSRDITPTVYLRPVYTFTVLTAVRYGLMNLSGP